MNNNEQNMRPQAPRPERANQGRPVAPPNHRPPAPQPGSRPEPSYRAGQQGQQADPRAAQQASRPAPRAGQGTTPNFRPTAPSGRPQTRPPQAQPPAPGQFPSRPQALRPEHTIYTDYAPQKPRKQVALLPILAVLVVVALLGSGIYLLFFKNSGSSPTSLKASTASPADLALRENVNQYRVGNAAAQASVLDLYNSLNQLWHRLVGTDKVPMHPQAVSNPFVSAAEDWIYEETYHPTTMGRLAIPSIGTDGPLSSECTDETLYYGFGIFPEMQQMDEEGQTVILGHRILTKKAGMYYMERVDKGDTFYVDDYNKGKRYVYTVFLQTMCKHEEVPDVVVTPKEAGKTCLLVTCNPLVYNSSIERILVYGKQTNVIDIPADDASFTTWKQDKGQ